MTVVVLVGLLSCLVVVVSFGWLHARLRVRELDRVVAYLSGDWDADAVEVRGRLGTHFLGEVDG